MGLFSKLFGTYSEKELKRIEGTKQAVLDREPMYQAMTDKELQSQTGVLKERLAKGETLDDILPDAFVKRESVVIPLEHIRRTTHIQKVNGSFTALV